MLAICGADPSGDDASGVDGAWVDPGQPVPPTVKELLRHCGATYLPFLAANLQALQDGKEEVALAIEGRPYAQTPFRYQAKCLRWLRQEFDALPGTAREQTASILRETGCGEAFGL